MSQDEFSPGYWYYSFAACCAAPAPFSVETRVQCGRWKYKHLTMHLSEKNPPNLLPLFLDRSRTRKPCTMIKTIFSLKPNWISLFSSWKESGTIWGLLTFRAIALAVSHRLPTAMTRVRSHFRTCWICGGQSGNSAGFLQLLRFYLPIIVPPTVQLLLMILSFDAI